MDLKEHLNRKLNEARSSVVTYVNDHVIRFNRMEFLGSDWEDYADENDLDEYYDQLEVEIDYNNNQFKCRMEDLSTNTFTSTITFLFTSDKALNDLYKENKDLNARDLKCIAVRGRGVHGMDPYKSQIEELTDLLVWLFNNSPEPLF